MMDRELIKRLVDEHGRWFHEIELAPGIVVEIPRPRIVSAIDFDLKGGTVPGSGKRRDPT